MPRKACKRSLKNARQSSGDVMGKGISEKAEKPALGKVNYDTLNGFMGYHLKRASNLMITDLNATLKPFGLRLLSYTALVFIVDNPGMRLSSLAKAMDVERPNLVVIIDMLESREMINRERVQTDRRAYALNITLAGRQLCEKATAAVRAHEERLTRDLDSKTRETVIAAMKLIRKIDKGADT
jgi:DNA-binding MarR family transcriptional regulator